MTSDTIKFAVWQKGGTIVGEDSNTWRTGACGNRILYNSWGDTDSVYGWEIDHIVPLSKGGADEVYNMQPMQWEANRKKSNN